MARTATLEVWKPPVLNINNSNQVEVVVPDRWVLVESHFNVDTNGAWVVSNSDAGLQQQQRPQNPIMNLEITDVLFAPKVAKIRISNSIPDYKAADTDYYMHLYRDRNGQTARLVRLRKKWGPFTNFFAPFLHVRIVDNDSKIVLFAGRITDVNKMASDVNGTSIEILCKDALEEIATASLKDRWTTVYKKEGGGDVYRSEVVHNMLRQAQDPYIDRPGDFGGIQRALEKFSWLGINAMWDDSTPTLTPLGDSVSVGGQAYTVTGVDGKAFNILSNDASTLLSDNHIKRFERSQAKTANAVTWRPNSSGGKGILSDLTKVANSDPHTKLAVADSLEYDAADEFGYHYYVDPDMDNNNLTSTVGPKSAMFNYFRDGGRLATRDTSNTGAGRQAANTYGLTTLWTPNALKDEHGTPVAEKAASTKLDSTTWIPATKLIQRDSNFDEDSEELFTTFVLTYEGVEDVKSKDDTNDEGTITERKVAKTKTFELIYCFSFQTATNNDLAIFKYQGLNLDDEGALAAQGATGTDSAEKLDFYHVHPTNTDADGNPSLGTIATASITEDGGSPTTTNIGSGVCRAQYQFHPASQYAENNVDNIDNATYDAVLISDANRFFPTTSLMNSNDVSAGYVWLVGQTSGIRCRFRPNEAVDPTKGRPSAVWGQKKAINRTQANISNPDELRKLAAESLVEGASPVIRGRFTVSKAPYYYYDGKVSSIATASNPAGQRIVIKEKWGTLNGVSNGNNGANTDLGRLGFRVGMPIIQMDPDVGDGWDAPEIDETSGRDVFGYCYNIVWGFVGTEIYVDMTEGVNLAVGDHVRCIIPIRAGDRIYVDNVLADTRGEHVVKQTTYIESPEPRSEYKTEGVLEVRTDQTRRRVVTNKPAGNTGKALAATMANQELSNVPKPVDRSTLRFAKDFDMNYASASTLTWGAGNLIGSDGTTYATASGGTATAGLGLGGNMQAGVKYVLFVDPEADAKAATSSSTQAFNIRTVSTADFKWNSNKIVLGSAVTGESKAAMIDGSNVESMGAPGKSEGAAWLHEAAITGTLLKDGAVTATKIGDNQIASGHIQANAVIAGKIYANAVVAGNIAANAVQAGNLAVDSVVAGNIVADAIRATHIDAGAIEADALSANIISAGHIIADQITTDKINGEAVTSAELGPFAVTGAKLHADAVNAKTITLTGNDGKIRTSTGVNKVGSNAATGTGVVINNTGIYGVNSGTQKFAITIADGSGHFGSSGTAIIDDLGIKFPSGSTSANRIHFDGAGYIYRNTSGYVSYIGHASAPFLFFSDIGRDADKVPEIYVTTLHGGTLNASTGVSTVALNASGAVTVLSTGSLTALGPFKIGTQLITQAQATDLVDGGNCTAHTHSASGGVTSLSAGSPITVSASTGSVAINHASSAGYKHIPIGGSGSSGSRQVLTYNGSSGTATWQNASEHGTHGGGGGHSHNSSTDIVVDEIKCNVLNDNSGNTVEVATYLVPYVNNFYKSGMSGSAWDEVHAYDFVDVSDARVKTNIQDLSAEDSLILIDKLRPRSYQRLDYKGEIKNDKTHYGLIAQEVEEVLTSLSIDKTKMGMLHLPEAETITQVLDPDGTVGEAIHPRALSYLELVAPLIGAIKELKARIEVLEGN